MTFEFEIKDMTMRLFNKEVSGFLLFLHFCKSVLRSQHTKYDNDESIDFKLGTWTPHG